MEKVSGKQENSITSGQNMSENLTVDNGTPQGNVIILTLFSVMINYIFSSIRSSIGVSKVETGEHIEHN